MKLSFKGFVIEGVLNQNKRWYVTKNGQKSHEKDEPKELLRGSFKIDEYSIEYSAEEVKDLLASTKELTDIMVKSLIPAVIDAAERIYRMDKENREDRKKSKDADAADAHE